MKRKLNKWCADLETPVTSQFRPHIPVSDRTPIHPPTNQIRTTSNLLCRPVPINLNLSRHDTINRLNPKTRVSLTNVEERCQARGARETGSISRGRGLKFYRVVFDVLKNAISSKVQGDGCKLGCRIALFWSHAKKRAPLRLPSLLSVTGSACGRSLH